MPKFLRGLIRIWTGIWNHTGCIKYKGLLPDIELCHLHGNTSSGGHIGGPQVLATVENS